MTETNPSIVPDELRTIVTINDTKSTILERWAARERAFADERKKTGIERERFVEECAYHKTTIDKLADTHEKLVLQVAKGENEILQLREQIQRHRNNATTVAPVPSPSGKDKSLPVGKGELMVSEPSTKRSPRSKTVGKPPPDFRGKTEENIEAWLHRVETFAVSEGLEEHEVTNMASTYLDGPALDWWLNILKIQQRTAEDIPWKEFKNVCKKKWIKRDARQTAFTELSRIRQTGSIEEYNREFETILVPLSADFAAEDLKIHYYLKGLKPRTAQQAAQTNYHTLEDAMEGVTRMEHAAEMQTKRDEAGPKSKPFSRPFRRRLPRQRFRSSPPKARRLFSMRTEQEAQSTVAQRQGLENIWTEAVRVYGSDKAHRLFEEQRCLRCAKKGHQARDCINQKVTPEVERESKEKESSSSGEGEGRSV